MATRVPDVRVNSGTLSVELGSHRMRHALNEAAWAGRTLLHTQASIIFVATGDRFAATAWHGREANDVQFAVDQSEIVRFLLAGRRSVSWDAVELCSDLGLRAVMAALGLSGGLAVPIRAYGELMGLWLVADQGRRSFSDQDELALQTLAENLGLISETILLSEENLRYRREADALYDIGKEITELRDLDKVLVVIADQARQLLGADLSYIGLAYEEEREIRVRVTSGTRGDLLEHMVLKYGDGIGGAVAASRMPQLTDDYMEDPRPKPAGVREMAASEDIHSIIAVPMHTRTRLTGVLFVASRHCAAFRTSRIDLLNALGAQAAIAIENARLYEQEKIAAEKLRVLNAEVERERALLEANLGVQGKLLELVLENRGMQAIADTLSVLLGCPVSVDDHVLRPVCWSDRGAGPAPAPRHPIHPFALAEISHDALLRGELNRLREERRTLRLPSRPERRIHYSRIVAPVVAGGSFLGYVSALESNGELDETGRAAVEQASIVLALEFLKEEAAQAAAQRLARDFLEDVLFGMRGDDPYVFQRALRLGMDLRRPHRVIIFDIDDFAQAIKVHRWNDLEALTLKRRVLDIVNEVIQVEAIGGVAGRRSDSVLALVPADDGTDTAGALARSVQRAAGGVLPDLTLTAAIGRAATEPSQLNRSHMDAVLALRMVRSAGGRARVVAFEQMGVVPLLLQSEDQSGLENFMARHLGALLEYDEAHKTQLVQTLERFLANNGNLQRTADACYVHLNTLKYRIRRIGEIAAVDPEDADARFNLRLALAIHAVLTLTRPE